MQRLLVRLLPASVILEQQANTSLDLQDGPTTAKNNKSHDPLLSSHVARSVLTFNHVAAFYTCVDF